MKRKLIVLLFIPLFGFAQIAPKASDDVFSRNENIKDNELVVLSPFTVETTEGTGYRVHDTLAGTRFRSDVDDVGAAITEVSKDLMDDLAISNVMDLVGFLPSTTPESTTVAVADGSGQFRSIRMNIRGIFSEQIGRNFFSSTVGEYMPPLDPYNTDRFTLAAGANSILFGSVTPAGLVNFTTEYANLYKNSLRFSYRWDSYQSSRFEFATNKVIIKDKLAIRVNVLDEHKKGYRVPQYNDQKRVYFAVDWKPLKNTTITANVEGALDNNNTPFPTPFFDKVSKWQAFGSPIVPYNSLVSPATKATGVAASAAANVTEILLGSGLPGTEMVQNFKNYAISQGTLQGVLQGTNNPNLPNFSNPKLSIGNDRINDRRILIGDVEAEQKISDNLYIQGSYFYNHHQKYIGSVGNNNAYADASSTLNDGTMNPNSGAFFTGGGAVKLQDFIYTNATYRATITYHLELTKINSWLGHTDFAGLLERDDSLRLTDVNTLQNITPLSGYSTSIVNAQNSIQPLFYFNPQTGDRATKQQLNVLNYPSYFSTLPGVTARFIPIGPGTDSLSRGTVEQIAAQSFLLKDRLVTTVGYRVDFQNTWDVLNGNWPVNPDGTYVSYHPGIKRTYDPLTSNIRVPTDSIGAVYHILKNWGPLDQLSLTFNHSTNFQNASALPTFNGLPIGPSYGKTRDIGINLSLLKGKLNFKVSNYNSGQQAVRLSNAEFSQVITDYNNIWTAIAAANPSYSSKIFTNTNLTDTYNIASKGLEFSGTYEPNKNLRLALYGSENTAVRSNVAPNMLAYVTVNAPIAAQFANVNVSTSNGVQTVSQVLATDNTYVANEESTNGRSNPEMSKWKFSFIGNYRFTNNELKGFNLGGYVNWLSKPIIGNAWLNSAGTIPDFSHLYYGAVTMDTGAFIGYIKQISHKIMWKIDLNIRNLLNNTKLIPIRADSQFGNTGVQQNIDWRYVEPRSIILTNSFNF
jgi:outer membrane receptor protein involved in Fe transport